MLNLILNSNMSYILRYIPDLITGFKDKKTTVSLNTKNNIYLNIFFSTPFNLWG